MKHKLLQKLLLFACGIMYGTSALGGSGSQWLDGMHEASLEEITCASYLEEGNIEWATSDHRILSPEEERALLNVFYHAKRFSLEEVSSGYWSRVAAFGLIEGDKEQNLSKKAKQVLMGHNIRFVGWYIKRFRAFYGRLGVQDIFQAGLVGLAKAIENFDISFGVCLNAYSAYHIRNEVLLEIAAHAFSHSVPPKWLSYFCKWNRLESMLRRANKQRPSTEEVHAAYLQSIEEKLDEGLTQEQRRRRFPPQFFDKPVFFERMRTLKSMLRKNHDVENLVREGKVYLWWLPRVQDETIDKKMAYKEQLRQVLKTAYFTPTERVTLKMRFGVWEVEELYSFFQKRFGGRLLDEEEFRQLHHVIRMHQRAKLPEYSTDLAEEIKVLLSALEPDQEEAVSALRHLGALFELSDKEQVDRLYKGFTQPQVAILRGKTIKGKISPQAVDFAEKSGLKRLKQVVRDRLDAHRSYP